MVLSRLLPPLSVASLEVELQDLVEGRCPPDLEPLP